jgi:polyphosphate kinase 2
MPVADPGRDQGAPMGKQKRSSEVGPAGGAEPLKRKAYDKELTRLHVELVKLQEWVKKEGLKVCVVFEGRDGAGKGGVIKALTERVSPRVFRVVALPAPSEREKSQMYVQRYMAHFPAAGEVVVFDRSWYNRAGVERVMGFCSEEKVKKFLQVVPLVEMAMIESGILLIKYWFEVSMEEQTRRLQARIDDGRKLWKLSPMDLESYTRWDDYTRARDEMFAATDTTHAPWFVVRSDDKRKARLNCIEHLLSRIPYKDVTRAMRRVELPKRKKGGRSESKHQFKYVPERH